ncbi:MAG: hypothetical protein R3Y54_01335 [Eubacteriales bacterium]
MEYGYRCLIVDDEITQEECDIVTLEVYKEKNGKELPKKMKRIVCWKGICKECRHHKKPKKNKKRGN